MNEGLILNILNSFKVLVYCQAQPQLQLSWAELALLSISPSRLAGRPAGQNSTEPSFFPELSKKQVAIIK